MDKQKQLGWAKVELKKIMEDVNKTRYKALISTPDALKELEYALLSIAFEKSKAYKAAISGASLTAFGWIKESPEMAKHTLLLQQNLISVSDIFMLPD